MILIIIINDNDYQYHFAAHIATKKCIGAIKLYVYVKL